MKGFFNNIRWKFVRVIYGDHNSNRRVKKALNFCFNQLTPDDKAINIGAGVTRLHDSIINVDIFEAPYIDVVASAEKLPFDDNSIKLVVTQEVLEHVSDPFKSISEIARVLKPGGYLYCQLPFIIGYHPGPTDFWRFTREGITELIQGSGLRIEKIEYTVGPATGFYRIVVEFIAILLSFFIPKTYFIFKGAAALLLYPIKFLDIFLVYAKQADRVAGGYFVIARKTT